jgi:hypothetical protein
VSEYTSYQQINDIVASHTNQQKELEEEGQHGKVSEKWEVQGSELVEGEEAHADVT